jgi:hypothetical protein
MVEHAGRVTTCWISAKGRQLLEAIEQWYPPANTTGEGNTAEPSAAPNGDERS